MSTFCVAGTNHDNIVSWLTKMTSLFAMFHFGSLTCLLSPAQLESTIETDQESWESIHWSTDLAFLSTSSMTTPTGLVGDSSTTWGHMTLMWLPVAQGVLLKSSTTTRRRWPLGLRKEITSSLRERAWMCVCGWQPDGLVSLPRSESAPSWARL